MSGSKRILTISRRWSSKDVIAAGAPTVIRQTPPAAQPDKDFVRVDAENKKQLRRRILGLSHPVDISLEGIKSWAQKNYWAEHIRRYTFDTQLIEAFGPELAAAYFFVARGGAVKLSTSERWHSIGEKIGVTARSENQLLNLMPTTKVPNQSVEAVVLSGLPLIYESFAALAGCSRLRYLDLSQCKYVDDFCLLRLHYCHQSLRYLDISGCHKVSDRGVSSLQQLRNLRHLVMNDLPQVTSNKAFMLSLETALPNCLVTPSVLSEKDLDDLIKAPLPDQ